MRVTGDCLRDARAFVFAADFFIGLVDFFAALFRLAAGLDALFDAAFDALFALLLPRDAARFDAVDDLRRAFPPDDFDADAMINSSRKVRYNIAQDSRAMSRPMRDKKTTRRRPSVVRGANPSKGTGAVVSQNHRLVADCNPLAAAIPPVACRPRARLITHATPFSTSPYRQGELTHADSIRFRIDAVSTTNRKFGILR